MINYGRLLLAAVLLLLIIGSAGCQPKNRQSAGAGGGGAWGNAQDFSFKLDGKETKLSSYGGQPLVVNFWAVW